jgi:catechol 2,3-dioxygenase-like lactoylglutathione lyase family enzyme
MDFLHTGLVVRDLDRMTEFYTGVLGLRVLDRIDSVAPEAGDHTGFLGARRKLVFLGFGGGHQLELVKYFEPESPEAGCDRHERGSMHVCFQVDNLQELYEKLSNQGVKFLTEPKFNRAPDGKTVGVVYFQDPEDNWLEFVQHDVPET